MTHQDSETQDSLASDKVPEAVVWRDGELIPSAEATVHVLSHMAARGSQVFDVMLVTRPDNGPAAVGLRAHVARFLRSADLMGMEDLGSLADVEQAIARTVMANLSPGGSMAGAGPEANIVVKMIAAWVEEGVGVLPARLQPSVHLVAYPSSGDDPSAVLSEPASARSAAMPKIPADILPPSLKVAASYTPGVREQLASRAAGFDHTVFKTTTGDMAESTTLSMLAVTDGRIVAPPLDSVLDGITRRILLDVAQHLGIPVDVRAVRWSEVTEADELVLASTNQPLVPIARLDDQTFDAPGPVTQALAEGLSSLFLGLHPLSATWLTPLQGLT